MQLETVTGNVCSGCNINGQTGIVRSRDTGIGEVNTLKNLDLILTGESDNRRFVVKDLNLTGNGVCRSTLGIIKIIGDGIDPGGTGIKVTSSNRLSSIYCRARGFCDIHPGIGKVLPHRMPKILASL